MTLTTTLNSYVGDGAYLALYVTDAAGAYVGSLWMAGGKSKYYEHLSDGYAATRWSALFFAPPDVDPGPVQAARQGAVDAQMSTWRLDSNLMRLNAAPVGDWQGSSPDLARVLALGRGVRYRHGRCGAHLGLWPRSGRSTGDPRCDAGPPPPGA